MAESAKEILDLRFAKGEISEADYRRMLNALQSTAASGSKMGALFNSVKTGMKDHLDNQPFLAEMKQPQPLAALTDEVPFEVTDELSLYKKYLIFKGRKVVYSDITSLEYVGDSDTLNGLNTSVYRLDIVAPGSGAIHVKSMTMLIGRTQKGKRIGEAYRYLSQATFKQRMAVHVKAMEEVGYTMIEGVRVYPNGDVVQGSTKANVMEAAKKNCLLLGTQYRSWSGKNSSTDPNEIIIGNGGTSIFSSRVKFTLTKDKDVEMALLRHFCA